MAGAAEEAGAGARRDDLKLYWDHFFKAETGTYEKSTWLELFLAEFLIQVNEGADPKELINFCPVSGVVSLVGCELLCGIHRVTSSINAHYALPLPGLDAAPGQNREQPTTEDLGTDVQTSSAPAPAPCSLFARAHAQPAAATLRRYLLGGVAWRALLLLKALGVQGLSCCRQLSSVLIWLFGELGGGPPARPPAPPATAPATHTPTARTPIHQLFSHKIWAKQKSTSAHGSKANSAGSSEKSYATGRSRHMKSDTSEKRRKHTKPADQSSESGDSNEELHALNRSLAVTARSLDHFQYFDSPARSSDLQNESLYADPYYSPRKPKPKADDYMNEKHKEIINSEVSTFEFTLIITDLLQELCRTESGLSGSEGSQISVQCINFSLRNLCSLQFGSLPTHAQYTTEQVASVKVALTELLIVSLDRVLIHSDLCAKLINNGILPMLLRILEDVICKCSSRYRSKDEQSRAKAEPPNKTESENLLKFVFGIGYSITAFFHCLLMQCRSIEKLREFTDQFKLYGECLKGGLLKDCIELMIRIPSVDQEDSVVLIKKLIESIGKLISGMKRVRSEVVHSAACPRTRHKVCRQRVQAGMHHHHDILGEIGTGLPLSSTCCISVLYGTLTSLVTDEEVSAQSVLRNKILHVMQSCGVCCCFPPGFLMECIVRLMLKHSGVAILCLQLLEHTVYRDLGASVLVPKVTDQLPCSTCEPGDDMRDLVRKYCPHGVTPMDRKNVWSFLIHYNSLLQLDNHSNVLHATVSHLLRVTPKCRMEMKYELLFSVIYPTFIVAKHRYMIRLEESAYFLTVSCLNIFASLLNTVSFAEQFIQKGGLSYVLELVSLPEFSNQCCSILEIAITVEIFKLMKDNDLTYYREMSSLASVQMLFKSLSDMTDKCFKIYKLKLPAAKFEELCDVSKERESLAVPQTNPIERTRPISAPQAMTGYASSENVLEESIEDYIEVLKNICTFWKCCASLCLYSPMFREYVVTEAVFVDSFAVLKVVLHCLCHCACAAAEVKVLVRLLEAVLTVQFAAADVTSGRSKQTSCGLVRAALSSPEALREAEAGGGSAGGVRALCEALIRVAVAQPSHKHAMPRPQHAKVPAVRCAVSLSSASGSASEGSARASAGRCDSGPSTPRPDTGYEADVEVVVDAHAHAHAHRDRKASAAHAPGGSTIGDPCPLAEPVECGEYGRGGELAHPELCLIVVDILNNLIQQLLSSPASVSRASLQRRVCSLSRACCTRLSAALCGRPRGAAHPRLLQRVLDAPAAALLTSNDTELQELQRSILELVHVVASQSLSPSELCLLLRLFASPAPPLALLLPALCRLADEAKPHTPDDILSFPTGRNTTQGDVSKSPAEYASLGGASSQSPQAEGIARRLQEAHLRAGIDSAWSRCALRCGVDGAGAGAGAGAGWAPWLQGFALTAWLRPAPTHAHAHATQRARTRRDYRDDDSVEACSSAGSSASRARSPPPPRRAASPLAHVLAVGHDSLLFEVWIDTNTGDLSLRLSRPEPGQSKVVSERRVESALSPHGWSCVALNVREVVHKRRIHIQVTVYVNGCECETVSLPLQGILVRKVTPSILLLGDAGRVPCAPGAPPASPAGAYHLAHVWLHRAPVLTAYSALHQAAHGPDHACQVRCESPNFPLVLTPSVLDSDIDWDQVYELSGAALRELHDNLLLSFSAHSPDIINLYHQTAATHTVFSGRVVGSVSGGGGGAGGGGGSIPEALFPAWSGAPRASRHHGLPPALYILGGADVLLYLFARVVELEGSAEEQALALSLLLRVCRADGRLHAQLHADGRMHMIHTVFAARTCRLSQHMLKVILDEACSAAVLSCGAGGALAVLARSDAVLREPALLLLLTRSWAHLDNTQELSWDVEGANGTRRTQRGSLWALAVCCARVLVRDGTGERGGEDGAEGEDGEEEGQAGGGVEWGEHPRRAFNQYQMARVDMLRHLLNAFKERFLYSSRPPLDGAGSADLVCVVRGLMGAPPQPDRLALLTDFLLLMHQASDTFVTHSRANYYFLLCPEPQETSEFAQNTKHKRRSSRQAKRSPSDVGDAPSSASVTSDDVADSDSVTKESADRLDHSSGESTKEMKGIINTQIKEGRKHISSTSENSDAAADGPSGGCGGEGRPERVESPGLAELKEYVVVGAEDVRGATEDAADDEQDVGPCVVRAGAEREWAACAGLLLLLRDAIALLPEHALAQAVCGAVHPSSLAVLANHRSGRVRAAAVRALAALQRRATHDTARRLAHQHYYVHLANQISLYPGSMELAAACAALLTKCDVPLQDQLHGDIWADVREEAAPRAAPLLALLARNARDVPLAHNIAMIIRRLIDKVSLKALSEVCVAEAVVAAIREVGLAGGAGAGAGSEGRGLLLEDLHDLLNRLAVKALGTQHTMQTIAELHHLLTYVELSAEDAEGEEEDPVVRVARDAQLSLFMAQLDHLEERLHAAYAANNKYANYFTTVLSSAVSLGPESASRGERAELAARHLATAARAAAFLVARAPHRKQQAEAALLDRLLATLLPAVSGAGAQRPKWWVSSGADWASPLQDVFWWSSSPAPGVRALQPGLLRALYRAPPHALRALTPVEPAALRKLSVYLLLMVQHQHWVSECGRPSVELCVTDWAREWALGAQAGLAGRPRGDALAAEAARLLRDDERRRLRAAEKQRLLVAKAVFSRSAFAAKVTEGAMSLTRAVVDVQNGERKAFMQQLRRAHAEDADTARRWQRVVDTFAHEQGVWHDPLRYPQSWQLDPTEGPGRVRVRLRRAHLRVPHRLLKHQHRHKAETVCRPPPLCSVLCGAGAGGAGCRGGGLAARLQLHETVAHTARVTYVTVDSETAGELLLSDRCIHFVPDDSKDHQSNSKDQNNDSKDHKYKLTTHESGAQSWPVEAVVQVYARRWCLQERAVELFLSSGHAHLLAFDDVDKRTEFLKALNGCHLPNRTEPDTLADAMTQWRNGAITNWEYLMRLNGLGGRSYNDLMQYPVLPFVIADYCSRILNLNDPKAFRDLAKPVAIQNKKREQNYINTYNDMLSARRDGPLVARQPHHYASLYSNSGGVLHYLVRMPPFTELFLSYQDNNFDMPDRTFHSLPTTWRLITHDSPTDVKELIPELFYLPELFRNNEGLNLGVRQCGASIDDVELPPWAADARLFTLIQRQALESALVSERLPLWIDLVFGYKQTGQAAVDALNVFPAATYYGFDPEQLENATDREAAATMVRLYGQAPRQLLRQPHPHQAPDLLPQAIIQMPVWAGVEGARWGRYCGSPALPPPVAVARRAGAPGAGPCALHALPHARSVAIAHQAVVPVNVAGESWSGSGGGGIALVSWGHSDSVVRLKRRRDARPDLLLHAPPIDPITKVSSSCVSTGIASPVVFGHASGRVVAVRLRAAAGAGPVRARSRPLHAHRAPVVDVHVCARAGLLATASEDGHVVLWDLNSLSYIRTVPNRDMLPVTHVTVSATLCDVATVHAPAARPRPRPRRAAQDAAGGSADEGLDSDSYETDDTYKYQSLLRVHTVNAHFVGSVKVRERVTCVCYSSAPEGASVNCVACGLAGGGVRLYSSWDLRAVGYIAPPEQTLTLVSLTYSSDSSLLFGCYADGLSVAWESAPAPGRAHAPARLLPAHALI